jgi:hypothetical protein
VKHFVKATHSVEDNSLANKRHLLRKRRYPKGKKKNNKGNREGGKKETRQRNNAPQTNETAQHTRCKQKTQSATPAGSHAQHMKSAGEIVQKKQ